MRIPSSAVPSTTGRGTSVALPASDDHLPRSLTSSRWWRCCWTRYPGGPVSRQVTSPGCLPSMAVRSRLDLLLTNTSAQTRRFPLAQHPAQPEPKGRLDLTALPTFFANGWSGRAPILPAVSLE